MGIEIPTTQTITDQGVTAFESAIGQNAPLNDVAFIRVTAAQIAMFISSLYRYGTERTLQNFAITATGADLDRIGRENRTIRTPATAAEITVTLPADNGTIIPIGAVFVGDANGLNYTSTAEATATGGAAIIQLTANDPGSAANLAVSDTLTISTQIAGAETVATITAVNTTGADEETDASYRPRVLSAIRTNCGGGNAADYRTWTEEVPGVKRGYPYSGDPEDPAVGPPYRTVYVEAETGIDPDGVAPQSLLDDVRESINTDPLTGEARQPLGLTDDTLLIRSIIRISLYFEIRNLNVNASIEAQVKTDIEAALENYSRSITPLLPGLDAETDDNSAITDPAVSEVVQNVVKSVGGDVEGVSFGLVFGSSLTSYTLQPGELAKSAGVNYVTT